MERAAEPTAFVTGAAGVIGRELIKVLVARGCRVFGLARSLESAWHLRRAGAIAVTGDLLVPGRWQDEAPADWVFHLPPCVPETLHHSRRCAERGARARATMDSHVLDAVAAGATRRVIYVADASCYGATGARPVTEDDLPARPVRAGAVTPALDRVDGYVIAGLPIVTALPGCVFGNASWFRESVADPIMAGRRVLQFGKTGPWVSPIHVHDCARALVHLAERGEVGGRYFLANSDAIRLHDFAPAFARIASRPLRVWRAPAAAAELFASRPLAGLYLHGHAAFSNIRLRGLGFRFRYSTLDQGLEQVFGAFYE